MSRDPTAFRAARARPARPLKERLTKIHQEEVAPLWDDRFSALLRQGVVELLPSPLTGSVLEIGCGEGALTAEILTRHQGPGRLVALEASADLLERARETVNTIASNSAGRVFFRPHDPSAKLPFAEETFDVVLAHQGMTIAEGFEAALAELVRVTNPGGQVMAVLPLAGTWTEVLDLLDEVLVELDANESRWTLAAHRAEEMDGTMLTEAAIAAGLEDVSVEISRWELVFRSGRELLYAPLVEKGPLPAWKSIASRSPDMNAVFVALKEAIDTYSGERGFATSVVAGRLSGKKRATGKEATP
jgi:ubiquinone/menaquinone biosynthesis C-methylase UbiE